MQITINVGEPLGELERRVLETLLEESVSDEPETEMIWQTALRYGKSPSRINTVILDEGAPATRVGKRWFVAVAEFREWVRQHYPRWLDNEDGGEVLTLAPS